MQKHRENHVFLGGKRVANSNMKKNSERTPPEYERENICMSCLRPIGLSRNKNWVCFHSRYCIVIINKSFLNS